MTTEPVSRRTDSKLLHGVLRVNGIFSAFSGLVLIVAARPVATIVGLNVPAVLILGVVVLLFGAGVLIATRRAAIDRRSGLAVAVLDTVWVVGSAVILLTGWPPFTTVGKGAVALIAPLVGVFAALEFIGAWRMGRNE